MDAVLLLLMTVSAPFSMESGSSRPPLEEPGTQVFPNPFSVTPAPEPLFHIPEVEPRPEMQPVQPDFRQPVQPYVSPVQPDLRPPQPDVLPVQPDLRPPQPDLSPPQPDLTPPSMDF